MTTTTAMNRPELTDAEIDVLLERFDQTEPKLQRRIIARFVGERQLLLAALKQAVEVAKVARRAWNDDQDAKVGKLLLALSGDLPGYRADTDNIHTLLGKVK
jgi:hypothetical protein